MKRSKGRKIANNERQQSVQMHKAMEHNQSVQLVLQKIGICTPRVILHNTEVTNNAQETKYLK